MVKKIDNSLALLLSVYSMLVRWEDPSTSSRRNTQASNIRNQNNNDSHSKVQNRGYPGVTSALNTENQKRCQKLVDSKTGNDNKINETQYYGRYGSMGQLSNRCPEANLCIQNTKQENNENNEDKNDRRQQEFQPIGFAQVQYNMSQEQSQNHSIKPTWFL